MSHWLVWADSLLSPAWVLCLGGVDVFVHIWLLILWRYVVAVDWRILGDVFINFLPLQVSITAIPLLCQEDWWHLLWICLLCFILLTLKDRRRGGRSVGQKKCSALEDSPPFIPLGVSPACPSAADRGFQAVTISSCRVLISFLKRWTETAADTGTSFSTDTSMVK